MVPEITEIKPEPGSPESYRVTCSECGLFLFSFSYGDKHNWHDISEQMRAHRFCHRCGQKIEWEKSQIKHAQ